MPVIPDIPTPPRPKKPTEPTDSQDRRDRSTDSGKSFLPGATSVQADPNLAAANRIRDYLASKGYNPMYPQGAGMFPRNPLFTPAPANEGAGARKSLPRSRSGGGGEGGRGGGGGGGTVAPVDPSLLIRTAMGNRRTPYLTAEEPWIQGFMPYYVAMGNQSYWG